MLIGMMTNYNIDAIFSETVKDKICFIKYARVFEQNLNIQKYTASSIKKKDKLG